MKPETMKRIKAQVRLHPSGCLVWGGRMKKGYGTLRVDGRDQYVHRLTYEARYGPIPPNLELDHVCNNKACCHPDHLEPVTHAENIRRAAARGVWSGEKNSQAKLSTEQVGALRFLDTMGALNSPKRLAKVDIIARQFNVCQKTIFNVLSAATYAVEAGGGLGEYQER